MYLCAAGDTHGALNRFYDNVLAFEDLLGLRFDWILHVGDFGICAIPNVSIAPRASITTSATSRHGWTTSMRHLARLCSSRATTRTSTGWIRHRPASSRAFGGSIAGALVMYVWGTRLEQE